MGPLERIAATLAALLFGAAAAHDLPTPRVRGAAVVAYAVAGEEKIEPTPPAPDPKPDERRQPAAPAVKTNTSAKPAQPAGAPAVAAPAAGALPASPAAAVEDGQLSVKLSDLIGAPAGAVPAKPAAAPSAAARDRPPTAAPTVAPLNRGPAPPTSQPANGPRWRRR